MRDIKAAMTETEWKESGADRGAWGAMIRKDGRLETGHGILDPADSHALAALALYGQSFGFTRDDVRLIRAAAECGEFVSSNHGKPSPDLLGLADRIEALLPPISAPPEG